MTNRSSIQNRSFSSFLEFLDFCHREIKLFRNIELFERFSILPVAKKIVSNAILEEAVKKKKKKKKKKKI